MDQKTGWGRIKAVKDYSDGKDGQLTIAKDMAYGVIQNWTKQNVNHGEVAYTISPFRNKTNHFFKKWKDCSINMIKFG